MSEYTKKELNKIQRIREREWARYEQAHITYTEKEKIIKRITKVIPKIKWVYDGQIFLGAGIVYRKEEMLGIVIGNIFIGWETKEGF